MSEPAAKIRVTKDDKGIKLELLVNGEKVSDVSYTDVITMIMQFSSSLRYR